MAGILTSSLSQSQAAKESIQRYMSTHFPDTNLPHLVQRISALKEQNSVVLEPLPKIQQITSLFFAIIATIRDQILADPDFVRDASPLCKQLSKLNLSDSLPSFVDLELKMHRVVFETALSSALGMDRDEIAMHPPYSKHASLER